MSELPFTGTAGALALERRWVGRLAAETDRVTAAEGFQAWLAFQTNHWRYTPFNCMLIYMQRASARYVASAARWLQQGRALKTDAYHHHVRAIGLGRERLGGSVEGHLVPDGLFRSGKGSALAAEEVHGELANGDGLRPRLGHRWIRELVGHRAGQGVGETDVLGAQSSRSSAPAELARALRGVPGPSPRALRFSAHLRRRLEDVHGEAWLG